MTRRILSQGEQFPWRVAMTRTALSDTPGEPSPVPSGTVTSGNTPDLRDYDVILANSSAGKDSQATLDEIVRRARELGVLDRVRVVHADLGQVEWPDTIDLAKKQADYYGVPFISVARPQGDLLAHIEDRAVKQILKVQESKKAAAEAAARGEPIPEIHKAAPAFPDAKARYCTSDHKTGQVRKVMTDLARQLHESGQVTGRPVRFLNTLGIRAEESPARAKRIPYTHDERASNGQRHVDQWYPIHDWSTADVWNRIRESGAPHHWAYDKGMTRLSCAFCPLASHGDLLTSARLNPELAQKYVDLEHRIRDMGVPYRFTQAHSMEEILEEAKALGPLRDDERVPSGGCPGGGCDNFPEGEQPDDDVETDGPRHNPISLGIPSIPIHRAAAILSEARRMLTDRRRVYR